MCSLTGLAVCCVLLCLGTATFAQTSQPAGGLDLSAYELKVVYEADFTKPLAAVEEQKLLKDDKWAAEPGDEFQWVYEGRGKAWTEGGSLVIENRFGADLSKSYHCVLWNTREMPADFLLEFTVSPLHSDTGLNIVFFAATARDGGSIFRPGLAKRAGNFVNYHTGDLDCYHVSYWATNPDSKVRGHANLRKNHGFRLVKDDGDDLIAGSGAGPHTVRILKVGGEITLEVNGRICLQWTDDGQSFGPILGAGRVGLRQMKHTERCTYDSFKVWQVSAKAKL